VVDGTRAQDGRDVICHHHADKDALQIDLTGDQFVVEIGKALGKRTVGSAPPFLKHSAGRTS
jgi:hypothetical protein